MDSEPRQESDSNDCFLTSDVQFGTEPINDQSEVAPIEPDSGGISQAKMIGRAAQWLWSFFRIYHSRNFTGRCTVVVRQMSGYMSQVSVHVNTLFLCRYLPTEWEARRRLRQGQVVPVEGMNPSTLR